MKLSSLSKKNIISSAKFLIALPIGLSKRKLVGDIWLVTERPNQARDNGFVFYKFLKENHFECNSFYIIDKTSEDYGKISNLGNIIQFDSWKHYVAFCQSSIHISAHISGCVPSNSPIVKYLKRIIKYRDVFIPHGVSYGISEFCLKKYSNTDLFICSGKQEYDNVLANYGYNESEVAYTGFPRLDEWHNINVNKKQIVLMPTWRLYISQDKNTVFEETSFYHAYQSLINNADLKEFLKNNELELVFYLHNDMRKYESFFTTSSNRIKIARNDKDYDIQQLLKESALLITDYSSVHFDFAYMNKPVLYYQFDKEEFFSKQYDKGLFDVARDGFGPVRFREEQIVEEIKRSFDNDFALDEKYYKRMRKFYELYDNCNSERVYQQIRRLIDSCH